MNHSESSNRRVVITGMGMLSPEGIGRDAFTASLREGRTGIAPIESYKATAAPGGLGGEVKGFDEEAAKKGVLKAYRKHIKVMGRDVQLGVAAAVLAIEDAKLDQAQLERDRVGVEFGANLMFSTPQYLWSPTTACTDGDTKFHMERWGDKGFANMEPLWMLKHLPNMPACHIGIFTDARGPNNSITNDEVSSNLALGEAAAIIRRGHADAMICGSTGVRLHPLKEIHARMWDELGWDAEHPERSVKPFDVRRNGNAIAEAAAGLILEERSAAEQRGATIWGEVLGSGSSCVASPSGEPNIRKALANAMRGALRSSGLSPADIGHINAQGNASPRLDRDEARAIHDVFGELGSKVPVVGLKGYHGNPGAAGGMLEVSMSLISLQQGVIPFTLNCEQPDPELNLNVVTGAPQATQNRTFLKLSYTLIGQASALIVRC